MLTPRNEEVDAINTTCVRKFKLTRLDGSPAATRTYHSSNKVDVGDDHGGNIYPTEFLNELSVSGIPPHELMLQEGCPVILLRNLSSSLANGTRLIVARLMERVFEAKVATGPKKGETVFIPRLSLTPSDIRSLPFTLCRRQFPLRPAFAMTVNKRRARRST